MFFLLHDIFDFASLIRGSMVKIMMTPDPRQRRAAGDGGGEGWQVDHIEAGGVHNASKAGVIPKEPSTCVFWCAVALGALARGSPLQTVSVVLVGRPDKVPPREKGLLPAFAHSRHACLFVPYLLR